MPDREFIYLVTDEIQLTPICEDCGPNLVPVMREEELIRCRDCKNWLEYKQGGVGECVIKHRYDHRSFGTNGKDYCSRAERRETC